MVRDIQPTDPKRQPAVNRHRPDEAARAPAPSAGRGDVFECQLRGERPARPTVRRTMIWPPRARGAA